MWAQEEEARLFSDVLSSDETSSTGLPRSPISSKLHEQLDSYTNFAQHYKLFKGDAGRDVPDASDLPQIALTVDLSGLGRALSIENSERRQPP